jgi:hypothetical protein
MKGGPVVDDRIIADIERAYESLSDPRYFEITRRLRERPFDGLAEELEARFELVDTTDEDDDVAFIYALSGGARQWALGLSAVAPYAVLARANPADQVWTDVLTPASPDLTGDEQWLMGKVAEHSLRLLSREELERPVPLNLVEIDPQYVRVYQALFTAGEILPWDRSTFQRLGLTD